MTEETKALKAQAFEAKNKFMVGELSRDEAKKFVEPYLEAVNARSKELAKKFNMRPKLVSFSGFMR